MEALAKRLHGNQAAVLTRSISDTAAGTAGFFLLGLYFCDPANLGPMDDCDADHGYALETGPLYESSEGSLITFDASNTLDFPAIAALLTDGAEQRMRIEWEYHRGDGTFAKGGAFEGPENSWFFDMPLVSTGPEFSDLVGMDLDRITLSLDDASIHYDVNTQSTEFGLDYRVFFGLTH